MPKVVVLVCAVALGCGLLAAGAGADTVVPVEGPWHATTSAGLPVAFEVTGGQVANLRFRFKWGFCGTYTSQALAPVAIGPDGHWKAEDGSGQYVEGTFVAPGRLEGVVKAPSRMTPSCPHTHATFTASPGAAPFKEPEAVVLAVYGKHRYVHAPKTMVLNPDGALRFERLRWSGWGSEVTTATGRAYIERGGVVRRPRVSVTLEELVEGGAQNVYLILRYAIRGRVPPGFSPHGERFMEEDG